MIMPSSQDGLIGLQVKVSDLMGMMPSRVRGNYSSSLKKDLFPWF